MPVVLASSSHGGEGRTSGRTVPPLAEVRLAGSRCWGADRRAWQHSSPITVAGSPTSGRVPGHPMARRGRSPRRLRGCSDSSGVAVEERPFALHVVRQDRPAVTRVARDDVQVEVEDSLEGDLAIAETLIPSQRRPDRRSARAMSWPTDQTCALVATSRSSRTVACSRDTTRRCPRTTGRRAMKTTTVSSSCTTLASAWPATMAQKMHPCAEGISRPVMRRMVPDSLSRVDPFRSGRQGTETIQRRHAAAGGRK
jgi:hypothetical protein